jgi:hypothetical protein
LFQNLYKKLIINIFHKLDSCKESLSDKIL